MSNFDACWDRDKKGDLKQAFGGLETVKHDCSIFKECLQKYEFMEHDIIDCSDNPTAKVVEKHLATLSTMIRKGKQANPVENYLVIFLFAGHGVLRDGM